MHVFGLQPKIRLDLAVWSLELHKTFSYFADKKLTEYKVEAMKVLEILLNKNKHNSYFGKYVFGGKQNIHQFNNPTLYLVVLTWLRQLQQCFFEYTDLHPPKDWNRYGCYCNTPSKVHGNAPTLSNINMSQVKNKNMTIVTDLSYLK